jgi:hypothetical protein
LQVLRAAVGQIANGTCSASIPDATCAADRAVGTVGHLAPKMGEAVKGDGKIPENDEEQFTINSEMSDIRYK